MNLARKYLPHYTYKDYKNWEGNWEIISGIAYAMSPAPSINHQLINGNISIILNEALDNRTDCYALLPVDWRISKDTIVQPDNSVVCYKPKGNYITTPPVIIFEILSPKTENKDIRVKFKLYEQEGVKYYCIVDPDEKLVKIYQNYQGRYAKEADITDETFVFNIKDCELSFDFAKIWKNI